MRQTLEPAFRGRIVANLAGQFRKYPEWSGTWWGPDPLAGEMPRQTQDWNPEGMNMVLQGLRVGLADQDASVRFQSIVALGGVGPAAAPILCQGMSMESDVRNQALLVEALGAMNDAASVRLLTSLVVDPERAEPGAPRPSTALPDFAAATLSARGWRSCTTRMRPRAWQPAPCRRWPGMESCRPTTWPAFSRAQGRWSGPLRS